MEPNRNRETENGRKRVERREEKGHVQNTKASSNSIVVTANTHWVELGLYSPISISKSTAARLLQRSSHVRAINY